MASESAESPHPVRRVARTVTPPYRGRSNEEMNLVGYLIIAGLLVLLVPLGPFLVLAWLVLRLRRDLKRRDIV